MKRQKLPLVCMACAIAVIAGFVAANWTIADEIGILSDAQLTSFKGGVKWCKSSCLGENCDCETHDCEDIECSPCKSGTTEGKCMGNDGDTADVTSCYYSDTDSDTCTLGTETATHCDGDFWDSTSSSCTGTPTIENADVMGRDCT